MSLFNIFTEAYYALGVSRVVNPTLARGKGLGEEEDTDQTDDN